MLCGLVLTFTTSAPTSAVTTGAERKAEVKLFKKINKSRTSMGLPPLTEHAFILSEVRDHSDFNSETPSAPPHAGFEGRVERIMTADSGIEFDICENEAFLKGFTDPKKVASAFLKFWKGSPEHNACLHDLNGWTSVSAAVGISRVGLRWWGTFIAAADSTP